MNTAILNEVKNAGMGDYRKADAMTQETIENGYLEYMATTAHYTPQAISADEKAQRDFDNTVKMLQKYERNGWTLSKELAEFKASNNL